MVTVDTAYDERVAGSFKEAVEDIEHAHALVWDWRKRLDDLWPTPSRMMCKVFAATEAWEAVDAWTRTLPEYSRNRDTVKAEREEWADCAMMVLSAYGDEMLPLRSYVPHVDRMTLATQVAQWATSIEYSLKEARLAGAILWGLSFMLKRHMAEAVNQRLERIASRVGYA